ncbi:YhcN/YlaJ family sporulation lipoprotein [Lutispora thermophila]|uniref:Sporulation lipoprotein, YhcN/YlaJ family n=1 Tax=Lutispora thermophila DSM 19022 TaxID=1122184 RepID=A0A1M6AZM9_9FIRM|nr:YhcN/YlaJ family sporulation lipoprotein [Lutispora thermophila]SHI41964.1 sporulation lipoprotein, YhcN/YlaJ family [Lutispora thermophila DSM 19022]
MKHSRNKLAIMLIIIGIVVAFSGCITRRVPDTTKDNTKNRSGSYSPQLGTPATESDNIAQAVQRVPGIKNAIAVTNGDIAYIGVNLDTNRGIDNTSKIESIKEEVADAARNADPDIDKVYVSADADFVENITRISNDVRNGKPVESFRDELNEIVNRVTPEKH